MKQTFDQALEDLCEAGFTNFNELESQTVCELAALKVMETPTDKLPLLERFDGSRELIMMVAKWIDTNDYELRDDIMGKLENLVSKAYSFAIQIEFERWNKKNEWELEVARIDREHLIYADNRQRI